MYAEVADDDDDFEPLIELTKRLMPPKLTKRSKKVSDGDDDDFEPPVEDFRKKQGQNTKKRLNNRTDDDDDDFQEPINIKKMRVGKQDKVRDTTKPTKTIKLPEPIRVEQRPFYAYHHEALSLRCSPSSFLETIRKFTQAQIADVKSIGSGPVLDINVNYICTHLGSWLVRNYDEEDSTLNIGNHRIKITRDSVYDVFGIPKGPNPVIEKISLGRVQ
ncbi:hypothetical protein Hdeb2414_s0001g00027631 [Helianthus debilis subsp. tardiflorus]